MVSHVIEDVYQHLHGEDIFMAQLYFTKVLDKKLLVQETGR